MFSPANHTKYTFEAGVLNEEDSKWIEDELMNICIGVDVSAKGTLVTKLSHTFFANPNVS